MRCAVTACVNTHDLLGVLDDEPPGETTPQSMIRRQQGSATTAHAKNHGTAQQPQKDPARIGFPAAEYTVNGLRLSELNTTDAYWSQDPWEVPST